MKVVAAVVFSVLLAGCAYHKEGVSPEQAARDEAECDARANAATATMAGTARGMRAGELKFECMKARGYQ